MRDLNGAGAELTGFEMRAMAQDHDPVEPSAFPSNTSQRSHRRRDDIEITQVFRRLAMQGVVSAHRADEAVRDFLDLRVTRYPHLVLLSRIRQLRHNFSTYDAAYIVLAEKLGAALVTRDARLASASGHAAPVELF